jgi:hypothetical protein
MLMPHCHLFRIFFFLCKDISELFDGLKLDEDGRVSFEELVQLFHASKMGVRDERDLNDADNVTPTLSCDGSSSDLSALPAALENSSLAVSGDGSSPQTSLFFRPLSTVFSDVDPFRTGLVFKFRPRYHLIIMTVNVLIKIGIKKCSTNILSG